VDFIIVINPASGPGKTPLPDPNYTREVLRLNQFANVRTIGYVAVNYGQKQLNTAFAEIAQYASWSQQNKGMAMQGIFLDESPQIADEHNTTFLDQVRANVKSQRSLSGGLLSKFAIPLTHWPLACICCSIVARQCYLLRYKFPLSRSPSRQGDILVHPFIGFLIEATPPPP
jgi:hypothetical protein